MEQDEKTFGQRFWAFCTPARVGIFYILAFAIASIAQYYKPQTGVYTNYNNYIIFKQAFFHLLEGKDLYIMYPAECWDLYKYSPAFALFMGVFAYLPDMVGLTFWNLLNAMVLWYALSTMPQASNKQKVAMLLFVFLELLTNIQNAQSNGLIAGLIVLGFNKLEKGDTIWPPLFFMLTVFIKIFGLVAFALFILYKPKLRLALYSLLWFLVLLALPILFSGYNGLLLQYQSWWNMLKEDHSVSLGLSVMGWLTTWFGYAGNKTLVTLAGVVLFCLPLIKIKHYSQYGYRLLLLASVLLWVIIFNHKAESPTFIIAVAGVAVWYCMQKKGIWLTVLVLLVFIFTSLSPTDIFPRGLRDAWVTPYVLKAVPCILVWGVIIYQMWFNRYKVDTVYENK